jgi:hypothetical protein
MKIKFYIITYNNSTVLNDWILNSLYNSNYNRNDVQIYVINNHTNFLLEGKYKSIVTVLHNTLRPDFSTGHLSRNHNQAIINGFKSLTNPDCDLVISCQNDTIVLPDWQQHVENLIKKYNFMAFGAGDQFQVFTAEGIRRVGLYDERFCNIGYQEGDFFLRNLLHNPDKSSINDYVHGRILNPENVQIIKHTSSGSERTGLSKDIHYSSAKYHGLSRKIFESKWGINPKRWNIESLSKIKNASNIPNFIYYPYFERDVEDLIGKNYICDGLL